jgi:hypothetical protein
MTRGEDLFALFLYRNRNAIETDVWAAEGLPTYCN